VRNSLIGAVALLVVLPVLGACSVEESRPSAASTTPTTVLPPPEPVVQDDVGEISTGPGPMYDAAVAQFGIGEVSAAVQDAARVAHIALADCHRWTTGEVDPRLQALVAPELLARALDELDRSREYGGAPVPSLLSHLPTDDGNGNDQAALVRDGCDDSAQLRFPHGPMEVRLPRGGEVPGLQVSCACVTEVRFGTTRVGAAQDWVFTMEPGPDGWRLADVHRVTAHVNWFPAPPA
jgi:hypothetical protein